jgi:USP8 interacting
MGIIAFKRLLARPEHCITLALIRKFAVNLLMCHVTGKQAVVVMACENLHMAEDMIVEPGLVMIFAHGVE